MKWNNISEFKKRIESIDTTIAVVGMGYVGLPLALTFAKKGFRVSGYDIDKKKVDCLNRKINYFKEDKWISDVLSKVSTFSASTNVKSAGKNDVVIVAVPTPADPATKEPIYDYVVSAGEYIGANLKKGSLVVLESTVGPGTTEGIFRKTLERVSGLTAGSDFGLSYSPERINPGDDKHRIECVPKVVSGIDDFSREACALIYGTIVPSVYKTGTPTEAELTKLLENVQRDTNIAIINEFAKICDVLGADIKNVIGAASTKWNFYNVSPGCGVGGHCLPDDPWFLVGALEKKGYTSELIKTVRRSNEDMPRYTARKAALLLGGKPNGAKITILGLTYKGDVSDIRNTPAKDIVEEMRLMGYTNIVGHDPFVPKVDWVKTDTLDNALRDSKLIIVATDHTSIKNMTPKKIKNLSSCAVIVDGRNALDRAGFLRENIKYAGVGR